MKRLCVATCVLSTLVAAQDSAAAGSPAQVAEATPNRDLADQYAPPEIQYRANKLPGATMPMVRLEQCAGTATSPAPKSALTFDYASFGLCCEISPTEGVRLHVDADGGYTATYHPYDINTGRCKPAVARTVALGADGACSATANLRLVFETKTDQKWARQTAAEISVLNTYGQLHTQVYDMPGCGAGAGKPTGESTKTANSLLPYNPVAKCFHGFILDYYFDKTAAVFGQHRAYHSADPDTCSSGEGEADVFLHRCVKLVGGGFSKLVSLERNAVTGAPPAAPIAAVLNAEGVARILCRLAHVDAASFTPSWRGNHEMSACEHILSVQPGKAAAGGGGGGGGGGVNVVLLLLVAVLVLGGGYCAVGIAYRKTQGATGMFLIPHYESLRMFVGMKQAYGDVQTGDDEETDIEETQDFNDPTELAGEAVGEAFEVQPAVSVQAQD